MKLRPAVLRLSGVILLCVMWVAAPVYAARVDASSLSVQLVTDEADAVLAILAKSRAKQPVTQADWQKLFSSEGYVRLKKREAEMGRAFEDEDFKSFVLSEKLASRAEALAATLEKWKGADLNRAAKRALAYLPAGAMLRAKIYPSIKPRENSFVFETRTDPAIFLYLDPNVTKEQLENTLAHEFHHIGYATSCPSKSQAGKAAEPPANVKTILVWISAFGEGIAMLAAAGGPDVHPHLFSKAEDRARWDKDAANFDADLRIVEKFFLDILEKRLTVDEEIQKRAFSFFGVQGPWYTVGWRMAVVIEKAYGRAKLIEVLCDPARLLETYNEAAARYNLRAREPLAAWSPQLIKSIRKPGK